MSLIDSVNSAAMTVGDWLFMHPFGILGPNLESEVRDKIYGGSYPNPPAPATPAAPATTQQLTVPGAWTTDQAIAAGADQTKQQNLEFFSQLAAKLNPAADNKLSPMVWAAAAVAVVSLGVIVMHRR